MRYLILDGSRILASLVRRLSPANVEVEEVGSFDEAMEVLRRNPPDAVIVNLGPADLPWQELKTYCKNHRPKIPVLFESCVYQTPLDAGIGDLNHSATFLLKPYGLEELRTALDRLFHFDADAKDLEISPETSATRRRRDQ
ncbi:MAG: response regulator [bacterium]|nr:response regulator [bacterium]